MAGSSILNTYARFVQLRGVSRSVYFFWRLMKRDDGGAKGAVVALAEIPTSGVVLQCFCSVCAPSLQPVPLARWE